MLDINLKKHINAFSFFFLLLNLNFTLGGSYGCLLLQNAHGLNATRDK